MKSLDMVQMDSKSLVIDTSALVALLLQEKESERINEILDKADIVYFSTASRLEACMVLNKSAGFTEEQMIQVQDHLRIILVPFTDDHAICAFEAFMKFGKGRHQAALNFGDCQTYATAKLARLPLLYIGSDFGLTDLEVVKL